MNFRPICLCINYPPTIMWNALYKPVGKSHLPPLCTKHNYKRKCDRNISLILIHSTGVRGDFGIWNTWYFPSIMPVNVLPTAVFIEWSLLLLQCLPHTALPWPYRRFAYNRYHNAAIILHLFKRAYAGGALNEDGSLLFFGSPIAQKNVRQNPPFIKL